MFTSVIVSIAIIAISLEAIHCSDCKESAKKCSKIEELEKEFKILHDWGKTQCEGKDAKTFLIPEVQVKKMKDCITTHLQPCIQDCIHLKELFIGAIHHKDFDLHKVCQKDEQDKYEHYAIECYSKNDTAIHAEGDKKCSIIREAMHKVKDCAGIK